MKKAISILIITVTVLGLGYMLFFRKLSENHKSAINSIPATQNYMINNSKLRYRVKEMYSNDFEIKETSNLSETESSIEITPSKPRPVDFAWASLIMKFEKNSNLPTQLKSQGYSEANMFGGTAYIKDLEDPNYIKEIILVNANRTILIKVYLNNPSTKQEFHQIITTLLNNLEFY